MKMERWVDGLGRCHDGVRNDLTPIDTYRDCHHQFVRECDPCASCIPLVPRGSRKSVDRKRLTSRGSMFNSETRFVGSDFVESGVLSLIVVTASGWWWWWLSTNLRQSGDSEQ